MATDTTPAPLVASAPTSISSTSSITHVVMHGRGALVTRHVTPEATSTRSGDHVTVEVTQITARASKQGVRVKLDAHSAQCVQAVRHERTLAANAPGPRATREEVLELERALHKAHTHKTLLEARHAMITGLSLMPARHRTWRESGPLKRLDTSLKISELIHTRQQRYDAEMLELTGLVTRLARDLEQAQLAMRQQSSTTQHNHATTTTLHITLSCTEDGAITPFLVSYLVADARWWPLYTLRLTQGGTHADLNMEAMVTQDSGENWDEVHIALSTADLETNAHLPTLAALKLGKRRQAPRSGYREAPNGLDRLFVSHDAFMSRQTPSSPPSPSPSSDISQVTGQLSRPSPKPRQESSKIEESGAYQDDDEVFLSDLNAAPPSGGAPPMPSQPMPPHVPRPRSRGFGFGSNGITKKASADLASHAFERQSMAEPTRKQRALIDDLALEERSMSSGEDDYEDSSQVAPTSDWLDFAHLVLGDGDARGRRGTLHPTHTASSPRGNLSRAEVAAVETELLDPRVSRGHYDHRYERAANIVSIPSDGVLHRIDVLRRATSAELSWRCVPLEEEQVFRLATIANPFEAPMLTGPIDVFVEGSFLLSTRQHHVDVGARLEIGLGVDERIRVARNVRTDEEQQGLLGGKTRITHTITTELVSNLGFEAGVQVIDRIPITRNDDIHIKELDHDPPARTYSQRDLLHEVEGGRQWRLKLAPGQKQVITSQYTITLSSKEEIVGGNRRD